MDNESCYLGSDCFVKNYKHIQELVKGDGSGCVLNTFFK